MKSLKEYIFEASDKYKQLCEYLSKCVTGVHKYSHKIKVVDKDKSGILKTELNDVLNSLRKCASSCEGMNQEEIHNNLSIENVVYIRAFDYDDSYVGFSIKTQHIDLMLCPDYVVMMKNQDIKHLTSLNAFFIDFDEFAENIIDKVKWPSKENFTLSLNNKYDEFIDYLDDMFG